MQRLLLTILCQAVIAYSFCQADSIPTKIDINSVEVVKAFEATLEDAKIQDVKAVLPVQKPFNPTYQYDITIVPIELKYSEPEIKPLAMNPDGDFIIKKGYVRAAYQHLINPSIKGGYYHMVKDKFDFGLHVDAASTNNSKKVAYQKYNHGTIDLFGSKMLRENLKLGLVINTGLHNRFLYHTDINVDSLYTEDESRRRYFLTTIGASLSNVTATKSGINYNLQLNLQDATVKNQDMSESTVALRTRFDKIIKENHILGLDVDGAFHSLSNDENITLGVFKVHPYFKFNKGRIGLLLGLNSVVSTNKKDFSVFPDLKVSYDVWKGKLMAFADIHLDNYTNNIYQVLSQNSYLSRDIDSIVNSVAREYAGGIKGAFGFFDYEGRVGFKTINDQMLLLNNRRDVRFFDMLYDDINLFYINGKVNFYLSDQLRLGGWITQNIYEATNQPKVWHLPNLEMNGYAQWSLLNDELLIRSDIFFGTRVDFLDKNGAEQKSNLLLDLSGRAEYHISDDFTLFFKGDNLLNNKFERFYGYPTIGTNIGGGFQWVF